MGYDLSLTTSDGHILNAYSALPDGETKGGMVIIQEIFGVNDDIRETVDNFAREGYHAIAPAMFDRIESGVILGFDETGMNKGRELKGGLDWSDVVQDVNAAISHVKKAGKVGIVGFCMGGSVAWFAASRSPVDVAICYYGGDIPKLKILEPKCSVLTHFGELDQGIPIDSVEVFKSMKPEVLTYTYPADHGFNCDHRKQFNQTSAKIALDRTLKFLESNL